MSWKVVWAEVPGKPGEVSEYKLASQAQSRREDRDSAVWDSVL